jgi:hypothetical protein
LAPNKAVNKGIQVKINLKLIVGKRVVAAAVLGSLAFMMENSVAHATTVYFNDADRGPADTLQIGGVTISSTTSGLPSGSGQPDTVFGIGLGLSSGLGPAGWAIEQAHFPVNSSELDTLVGGGGLSFQVDGLINSITIKPFLQSYSGSDEALTLPNNVLMEFTLVEGGPGNDLPLISNNGGAAVNLSAKSEASTWYLTPQLNWDPSSWYSSCRSDYLADEQTLQWGFSVVSLDYTPTPEPGTTTFLALGLIGFFCFRRAAGSFQMPLRTVRKQKCQTGHRRTV